MRKCHTAVVTSKVDVPENEKPVPDVVTEFDSVATAPSAIPFQSPTKFKSMKTGV